MKKLHFEIQINAPIEKVWNTMLEDATYRQWTSVFNPGGSYFEGDWSDGSKMLFLGPSEDGSEIGGMVARIKENRKHEFISIEHLGMIKNGVEDTTSEEVKKWTPAFENYTFTEKDGGTELTIDVDVNEEYGDIFNGMWPKSLQILKELAEK
jgi:hypothetical protein